MDWPNYKDVVMDNDDEFFDESYEDDCKERTRDMREALK